MSRGELSDVLMLVTGGSVRMERPGRALTLGPGSYPSAADHARSRHWHRYA